MFISMLYRVSQARLKTYCGEAERVNLDTESGNVLLLELSSQMTLDEGGLSDHG